MQYDIKILVLAYDNRFHKRLKQGTCYNREDLQRLYQSEEQAITLWADNLRQVEERITGDVDWVECQANKDIKTVRDEWMASRAFDGVRGAMWMGEGKWKPCRFCSYGK